MREAQNFVCLSFRSPSLLSGAFVADLWESGILGLETKAEPADPNRDFERLEVWCMPAAETAVEAVGRDWQGRGVASLGSSTIVAEDWMAGWREHTEPFVLGRGFTIDPRERPSAIAADDPARRLLHIPARQAFGTGSHESTRLIAEWLEDLPVSGASVLDVGSGTGILGLMAVALGARSVVGIDTDLAAALAGLANGVRNRLPMHFWTGGVESVMGTFDLVLVNILPHSILEHVGELSRRLGDGRLVYSGAIAAEEARVRAAFESVGLSVVERREDGEWRAMMVRRSAT